MLPPPCALLPMPPILCLLHSCAPSIHGPSTSGPFFPIAPPPGAQRLVLKWPLQGAVSSCWRESSRREDELCWRGRGDLFGSLAQLRVCREQRWGQQKRVTSRSDLVPVPKCHLHKGELTDGGTPDDFGEE